MRLMTLIPSACFVLYAILCTPWPTSQQLFNPYEGPLLDYLATGEFFAQEPLHPSTQLTP